MPTDPDQPFTIAFVGYTTAALAGAAAAYEDAVMPLHADHGARVIYRARRAPDQHESLPFEVHLTWFPNEAAFEAYLDDPRRAELVEQFGEVFTSKQIVEVEMLSA